MSEEMNLQHRQLTFVGLVKYIQALLSLHILRLDNFQLADGGGQELCLL